MTDSHLDIEEYIDSTGQIRRLGTLLPRAGTVSSFPALEDLEGFEIKDDAELRKLIKADGRVPTRQLLAAEEWNVNQGPYGSCNPTAAACGFSKRRHLSGIRDGWRASGANLYARINGNRDAGSQLADAMREAEQVGFVSAKLVPYNRIWMRDQPAGWQAQAKQHRAICCRTKNWQAIKTALANRWPCIVAIHAGGRFDSIDRWGISGVDNGWGNHAIHADDLVEVAGKLVADQDNTWGLGFGTRGRSYITEDHIEQTLPYHEMFCIVGIQEEA